MEYKPSPDKLSLKNLSIARSLSQNEVAEAIGTTANTVSRWERGVATPSPYYRRKLAEYFAVDPQELFSDPNGETDKTTAGLPPKLETGADLPNKTEETSQTDKTTEGLPPEPETGADLPNKTGDASQEDRKRPPAWRRGPSLPPKIPRRVYIPVASIMIFVFVLGGVRLFLSPFIKPSPDLFPALCSGNFQSTDTTIVNAPDTSTSSDREPIGLSEGEHIFDLKRPNSQEVQDKLQAAQDWTNNPQDVESSLKNALSIDPTDAEAQTYLENWKVLGSNHPYVSFVVGMSFALDSAPGSRSILQGAVTAQKECNNENRQDGSKTLIVLMIANIGGNTPDDKASSAKFVANQIADQAAQDKAIVGIMGWPGSGDSINVNHQLKARNSTLPMVSPSASSDSLWNLSYFFRICPPNKEQAQMAANFMLGKMKKKRIAILYDETTSYTNDLKNDFAADVPHNMVGSENYRGDELDTVQDALNHALVQNPDVIFFSGHVRDLLVLLRDLSSTASANLLIVGGDALAITSNYPNPLPHLDNVYFTAFASPDEWDDTRYTPPFFQSYQNNFGMLTAPNGLLSIDADVMLGYDAMLTLLHGSQQVLSAKNTINAANLTQALKQIAGANAIQGVTGRISFKDNGDQQGKRVILEHIEGTSLKVDDSQGCFRLTDNCATELRNLS